MELFIGKFRKNVNNTILLPVYTKPDFVKLDDIEISINFLTDNGIKKKLILGLEKDFKDVKERFEYIRKNYKYDGLCLYCLDKNNLSFDDDHYKSFVEVFNKKK